MLRYLAILVGSALFSCAAAEQGAAPVRDPKAEQALRRITDKRTSLREKWDQASADDRQYCDLRVGECTMQVNETRHGLTTSHAVPECTEKGTPEQQADCIVAELVRQDIIEPVIKYYEADTWCLSLLNKCVIAHQSELKEKAKDSRIAKRRHELEVSKQGIAWHARVAAAAEKIKYIRATLPPDADGECAQVSDNPQCDTSIQEMESTLTSELEKSDEQYNAKTAQNLFESMTKAQASCYEPELKCLSNAVAKYGETPESRRWLQRNFDMLDKRQRLIEKAGDGAAAPCLESTIASHQADIVHSYLAYVKEPVLYFRTQLHRSFLALHKSQIDCLGGGAG